MSAGQRQALFENTARSLAGVPEEIQQRHIGHCGKADRRYGDGVAEAIRQLRKGTP
jgi:catalase